MGGGKAESLKRPGERLDPRTALYGFRSGRASLSAPKTARMHITEKSLRRVTKLPIRLKGNIFLLDGYMRLSMSYRRTHNIENEWG